MKKLIAICALLLTFAALATPFPLARQGEGRDLVDMMLTVDQFDTFLMLTREADLTFALKRAGPYTVFAPTNDAFNKLGPEKLQALMSNKKSLRRLLLSHVIYGRYAADQVAKLKSVKTLAGGMLKFENVGGHTVIGGVAHYSITNVVTHNGLVHGIDTVLTPDPNTPYDINIGAE